MATKKVVATPKYGADFSVLLLKWLTYARNRSDKSRKTTGVYALRTTNPYRYTQLLENHHEGKWTVQRVPYPFGWVDRLMTKGTDLPSGN